MQTLFIETKTADGKPSLKSLTVVRSWMEVDGRQIYLFSNGIYGYKDGAPIESIEEVDRMPSMPELHRQKARHWWDLVGKDASEKFYAARSAEESAQYDASLPTVRGDASDFDAAMYIRRPEKNRSRDAFSEPTTWPGWFDARPDWWGAAPMIVLGEFRYELVDPAEAARPAA